MLKREHMLDEGRKPPSTIGWKEGKREHSGRRKERVWMLKEREHMPDGREKEYTG